LKVPKDYYKKFEAQVTVNVTGEQRNKAATLESLLNIMTTYAQNPIIGDNLVLMQIFSKIVELSGAGISPISLMGAIKEQSRKAQEQQMMIQQGTLAGQGQINPLSLSANPA
jgi:hypothetical protein